MVKKWVKMVISSIPKNVNIGSRNLNNCKTNTFLSQSESKSVSFIKKKS